MSLEAFHSGLRTDIKQMVADRYHSEFEPFPSEELVFAEWAMDHLEEVGISEAPVVCHWGGKIGNASLRVSGYSLSADETGLDLYVTSYFGTDEIRDLKDAEASSIGAEGVRFLMTAAAGRLESRVAPSHPVKDLVSTIVSHWATLDRIRVFVLTDGRTKGKRFVPKEVQGKTVSVESMDIERLFRHLDGRPRDEIVLNLSGMLGRPMPCVYVPDAEADYDYALAALPGIVLRELYVNYGTRLLEANVRTFLGSKKTVNKGISDTLKNEPEHFLAFNNGLVLVCDEAIFERVERDGVGLSFLRGLQIVNGGQTTSTIYFATRDDRAIDLSHVMVPVKIIILKSKDDDARDQLITKVSRFANSQSAIKQSDLSANRPFHVQLEKLAEQAWCPDGATRWFYERAAGAYNVMLLKEGTTPAKRRKLQEMIPPKRKLSKNDIAKYHEAWRRRPHQVALAGEKNFKAFMDSLDEDPSIVPTPLTADWYRAMIAKVILFKSIESLIKAREVRDTFKQGWVNIATYVIALTSETIGDRLDLQQIWTHQGISEELASLLSSWATAVNQQFELIAPGQQISEVAKRESTWVKIRSASYLPPNDKIPELRAYGSIGR
jgi:hypothetical protein